MDIITRGAVIRALLKMRKQHGIFTNAICSAVDRVTNERPGYWYEFLYQNTLRKKDFLEQFNNTEPRAKFLEVASSLYPQFGLYLKEPMQTDSETIEAYKDAQEGLKMVQYALDKISRAIIA